MTIDAQSDLVLDHEEADSIVGGGNERSMKPAKAHKTVHKTTAPRAPLMIYQAETFGGTTESANSGDDDCAPDPSSPDATS